MSAMAVELDTALQLRRFSVDEYMRMGEVGILGEDERLELLRGAIVQVSPPSPDHDDVIEWLNMRLVPAALEAGVSVRVQSAIVFYVQDSVPMPDLAIVDPRPRRSAHPTTAHVLIEVSVSSLRIDRRLKAEIYAAAGIPEYWVVDVIHSRLLRHARPSEGEYQQVDELAPRDELRSVAIPGLPPISVAELLAVDPAG